MRSLTPALVFMKTRTQTVAVDVSFVAFQYCPRLGDRMTVALAAFGLSVPPFRAVMVRKDCGDFVTVLGSEEDAHSVSVFLNQFTKRFLNCACPDDAIGRIREVLQEEGDVIELSDIKTASGSSTASVVSALISTYLENGKEFRA
jgi:hypothetical protein